MLEGLEIVEVLASKIRSGTETWRFDPEYFQKQYLEDERLVAARSDAFCSFANIGISVDASAFYPSIESYYGEGSLPFLRVADVDSIIDFETCTCIPEKLCSLFPTLVKVWPGDILFTKGGSVARIGLVTKPAAVSRDLIFLNTSKLSREDQSFLYLYFQSNFFNRALLRSSSQTAQPHLTITLVRNLSILVASDALKVRLLNFVESAFDAHSSSIGFRTKAETALLRSLAIESWQTPEPLSYVCNSLDTFATGRLDAEYFQPKYAKLLELIEATGRALPLADLLQTNQRGKQPEYTESGLSVVNSKHVANGEVRVDADNRYAISSDSSLLIELGDVLINGTGVGTIGRAAPYLHPFKAIPDNHVTILRPHKGSIDPVYLAVFLNSLAGQLQVDQRFRGSSGQIELYPNDIAQFTIWVAPENIQAQVRQSVEASFQAKQRATQLLDAAKHAVEIAIEDSEAAALAYLAGVNP